MILKSLLIILGVILVLWGISACIIMEIISSVIKND
ncbi:hypothetical protein IIQ_00027 [Bacillus cereus VD118]|uniref:Lipoprotein n=2 Tax=Bacillus cereus TaxID=1396 RepID=R8QMB2_BACCE|nr:hypothetical protein IIC_04507 [Bacillus cereus VD021]EOP72210.1 hypothetical protein IIQ_00027 [Bacillus cereus VD118]CAH2464494.1 hypothetical protein ACOSJ1_EBGNOMHC_05028 [Bacillus mycoides KBAB4]